MPFDSKLVSRLSSLDLTGLISGTGDGGGGSSNSSSSSNSSGGGSDEEVTRKRGGRDGGDGEKGEVRPGRNIISK